MEINAVFEGGGVKGIALAGAVEATEQAGRTFRRVAGTSSGSIIASLLAAGYDGEALSRIIRATPFTSFLKRGALYNTAVIGPAVRVLIKKGLYSGQALEAWIKGLLHEKGVNTFSDLPQGKLSVIASDITNGRIVVLPDDLALYGISADSFEVAKAVRMSCSIPYFFDPVMLRLSGAAAKGRAFTEQFVYMVDGGMLSNFPLWLFDEKKNGFASPERRTPTVGYQLIGKAQPQPHRITGPFSMLQAMVGTMLSAHDERYIETDKFVRTVKIPTLGISTTQFHISPEQSEAVYNAGLQAGAEFFKNWRPYQMRFPASPGKKQ
ncbi:patatin-like phospholipase family protein [Paenibacillus sp. MMS20-IR301]|uniref:patatin-like phospholipase family protein n=1 Tax=Paenibacillus sp. MMS20-IR301 TaxID=2895946 RepID=UPI0028EB30E3|nr:patatin-like phospholipase family protein [Paenibacillus sp. MMS20-IR301]WNS44328.1 patatin-like phospholipase family protein [Paenibacillus sp. MMS20-IR301]